ncbi:glutamate-5-semialdehyde dehydrogenase [Lachnoanaerobaculum saburreum]|uniref:Gamma-glutamyl phosphate reductase n=1 Tax=Lachnoanaerobaculum saburreum TaxID=467210 RepID=A0A133ZZK0_9FIRM|nr:glutamate-5-semialdehyde dehydrogenase [Lachnoanaerobaculum saburreum]KXB60869.1 glutamate-5-semialdehyde dehydrogenase [Lachnoanaerobaculum saburreum]
MKEIAKKVKADSFLLMASSNDMRNTCLKNIIENLKKDKEHILAENKKDIENAENENISSSILSRLLFDEHKMDTVIAGINDLIKMPDPIGKITLKRELDEGLVLTRTTTSIGVIGVIFEARPDALVQIASLCIKSGNAAILKGGSEALLTNRALFESIKRAVKDSNLPEHALVQLEARSDVSELLSCYEYVDLLIPRGSNSFVKYIMDNTNIPVMGHADGICHTYVDEEFDLDKSIRILVDAKTQYPSACNTTETILVHKNAVDKLFPRLNKAFNDARIKVFAHKNIIDKFDNAVPATDNSFHTEYLEKTVNVKTVDDIDEAINHINTYGSHHTDAILTNIDSNADYFMNRVDSANVYKNCSTRFADGFRYGFGAEVGISTGKLHARGPVGLEGLCTYKYKLYGNGDIVADYADGKKEFHFKDL